MDHMIRVATTGREHAMHDAPCHSKRENFWISFLGKFGEKIGNFLIGIHQLFDW